jgi:hypothetical protein
LDGCKQRDDGRLDLRQLWEDRKEGVELRAPSTWDHRGVRKDVDAIIDDSREVVKLLILG